MVSGSFMNLEVMPIRKNELLILLQKEAQKEGWLFSPYDIDFCFNYLGNKLFAIKINNDLALEKGIDPEKILIKLLNQLKF